MEKMIKTNTMTIEYHKFDRPEEGLYILDFEDVGMIMDNQDKLHAYVMAFCRYQGQIFISRSVNLPIKFYEDYNGNTIAEYENVTKLLGAVSIKSVEMIGKLDKDTLLTVADKFVTIVPKHIIDSIIDINDFKIFYYDAKFNKDNTILQFIPINTNYESFEIDLTKLQ